MLYFFYLLLYVNILSCFEYEINSEVHKSSDSVLCRYCGSDILRTDTIISKLSPNSLHSINETAFDENEILIQLLSTKDFLLQFPVITSTHSGCLGIGEWEEDDYWFPGYHWKTCVCSECGAFLGWIFEPIDPLSVVIPEQFFGLIVPQLASKSCKYNFFFSWGWIIVLSCVLVPFLWVVGAFFPIFRNEFI